MALVLPRILRYPGLMSTYTTLATFAPCVQCGHHTFILNSGDDSAPGLCQDCYWAERDHFDAAVPPQSDDWDHVVVNHYRGL